MNAALILLINFLMHILNGLLAIVLAMSLSHAKSRQVADSICPFLLTAGLPVTIAIPDHFAETITEPEVARLKELYGGNINLIFDDASQPLPKKPQHIPGVLVHLHSKNGGKRLRGDFNVFPTTGALYERVLDNKWEEYKAIATYRPDVLPATRSATAVTAHRPEYEMLRRQIVLGLSNFFTSSATRIGASDRSRLVQFTTQFLSAVNDAFPTGAFIKYVGEAETGDRGQLIHTPEARAEALAEGFIDQLQVVKAEGIYYTEFADPALLSRLERTHVSAAHLLRGLLLDSEKIIVQQRLDIAFTRDGKVAEVRIDFTPYGPINPTLRWGDDVALDYERGAMAFFREFWDSLPLKVRRLLAGGADVVLCKDGTYKIIEFNFGSESAYADARQVLISAHIFISRITGHKTPLLQRLEALVDANVEVQVAYLSTTRIGFKGVDDPHRSTDDMFLPDAFSYLRDNMIEKWLQKPTAAGAGRLKSRLRWLAHSQLDRIEDPNFRAELNNMVQFGVDYIQEVLKKEQSRSACEQKTAN